MSKSYRPVSYTTYNEPGKPQQYFNTTHRPVPYTTPTTSTTSTTSPKDTTQEKTPVSYTTYKEPEKPQQHLNPAHILVPYTTSTSKDIALEKTPVPYAYQYPLEYTPPTSEEIYKEINTFVSGLKVFKLFHSKKYNKIVYLLGESHEIKGCDTSKNPLITADIFFFNLINTTKKFLDIYLESKISPEKKSPDKFDIIKEKKYSTRGYMSIAKQKLSAMNCGVNIYEENKNFQKCIYKNVRIHSVDIRSITSNHIFSRYIGTLNRYLIYCVSNKPDASKKEACEKYHKFLNDEEQNDFSNDNLIEKHFLDFYRVAKLEKQILSINNPEILIFIMSKFKNLLDNVSIINNKNVKRAVNDKINRDEKNKIIKITNYILTIMDIYCFSRIFRSFNKIEGVYSEDPKNIIIYAGAAHINQYAKWLTELEFELVYSGKISDFNCLEIKNFKPVFL